MSISITLGGLAVDAGNFLALNAAIDRSITRLLARRGVSPPGEFPAGAAVFTTDVDGDIRSMTLQGCIPLSRHSVRNRAGL